MNSSPASAPGVDLRQFDRFWKRRNRRFQRRQSETGPVELSLTLSNSVIQVKEFLQTPKIAGQDRRSTSRFSVVSGRIRSAPRRCSFRPPTPAGTGSWGRNAEPVRRVKQWVGSGGKSIAALNDLKSWINLWGKNESQSFARLAPFVGLRQIGNYSHECNPQDWQLEFPADTDATLVRARVGVNSYLAGPGLPFDQYRETIAYSDWLKGRLDLTALERPYNRLTRDRRADNSSGYGRASPAPPVIPLTSGTILVETGSKIRVSRAARGSSGQSIFTEASGKATSHAFSFVTGGLGKPALRATRSSAETGWQTKTRLAAPSIPLQRQGRAQASFASTDGQT